MSDAPTWYDLLDVPRDASTEEVRAAWKGHIADLEPGDRRFDSLTRAAKVLLDPVSRAAYDATLAAPWDADALLLDEDAPAPVTKPAGKPGLVTRLRRSSTSDHDGKARSSTGDGTGGAPAWLLAGLGVVAAALVAGTAWMWLQEDAGSGEAARAAQTAAERAVVPVLSYDFENLEADREAATAEMTGRYRTEYDKLFVVIEENAPQTETKVGAEVVASGIVRAADDRVQVLVFVDRPTTNKLSAEPTVYKDQVTLSMQLVDDVWLVDDMVTSPVQG